MHSSTSHLLPFPLPQFSIFDSEALKNIFIQENINLKHILTLQKYVAKAFNPYQLDFTQLKGIPNKCKEILNQHQFGLVSKVIQTQQSEDGSTTKLVIQLPSKKCIETVVMHYDRKHSFKSNLQHELELELGVNENPSNANKKSGSVLQPR
ncbi:hypothetical protein HMI55_006593 [Coelomomyces lativittatus]|nr:hypothetical protein HMI55_006593 [Coelomomyces lativittatus]